MLGIQKYVNLLKSIKKRFTFKVEWHGIKKKNILLRHDIDFSLDSAKLIAKKENELKINSTYFFMLSSNMYNVFSETVKILFMKLKNLDIPLILIQVFIKKLMQELEWKLILSKIYLKPNWI